MLYRAMGELVEIPLRYGCDAAQWRTPIADCLESQLGMDMETTRQWELLAGISGYLETGAYAGFPEKRTG